MASVYVNRTISAGCDRVWQVFTDVASAPSTLSAVEGVELLTPGPFDKDSSWKETRTIYGKPVTDQMTVTDVDPGRSFTVAAGITRTRYESRFEFQAINDSSTTVRYTFSSYGRGFSGFLANTLWPLVRRKMAKELRRDLADLAVVCEGRH